MQVDLRGRESVAVEELLNCSVGALLEVVHVVVGEGRSVRSCPATLKVNVPFTVDPLSLKPPHWVNLPVSLGRLGSSTGVAVNLPVEVNVACPRPSSKTVSCSMALEVVVIV